MSQSVFSLCSARRIVAAMIGVAALSLASTAFSQDFSKVEIKSQKLSGSVFMLTGSGGNIGLSVGEDSTFIVDDQYAPLTEKIEAEIAKHTKKPAQFVLNTHWHGDHTGGNENFGKRGAIIMAHDNVRKRMNSEQFIEFLRMNTKPSPKAALPVVTFSKDLTLHLNGEEIYVFAVAPAHTDGDSIVHFRGSDVIHMGDLYFNGLYPFIDTSSGGRVDGVIAAADRVLAIAKDSTQIIPGHGPLATKQDLKAYRDMIETVVGRVRAMLKDGKKLEEIVAAKPTKDFDEKWNGGFIKADKWVEMLWNNVK